MPEITLYLGGRTAFAKPFLRARLSLSEVVKLVIVSGVVRLDNVDLQRGNNSTGLRILDLTYTTFTTPEWDLRGPFFRMGNM